MRHPRDQAVAGTKPPQGQSHRRDKATAGTSHVPCHPSSPSLSHPAEEEDPDPVPWLWVRSSCTASPLPAFHRPFFSFIVFRAFPPELGEDSEEKKEMTAFVSWLGTSLN